MELTPRDGASIGVGVEQAVGQVFEWLGVTRTDQGNPVAGVL